MGVGVDDAGQHELARRVDDLLRVGVVAGTEQAHDLAVVDQYVCLDEIATNIDLSAFDSGRVVSHELPFCYLC